MGTPQHRRFAVPAHLHDVVESFWYVEDAGAAGTELRLPGARAQVLANLTGDPLSWTDPGTGERHTTGPASASGLTDSTLDRAASANWPLHRSEDAPGD